MWKETIFSYSPIIRIYIQKYLQHEYTEAQIVQKVTQFIHSPNTHEFIQNVMYHWAKEGIWFLIDLL